MILDLGRLTDFLLQCLIDLVETERLSADWYLLINGLIHEILQRRLIYWRDLLLLKHSLDGLLGLHWDVDRCKTSWLSYRLPSWRLLLLVLWICRINRIPLPCSVLNILGHRHIWLKNLALWRLCSSLLWLCSFKKDTGSSVRVAYKIQKINVAY